MTNQREVVGSGFALTVRFTTRDAEAAAQFDSLVARTLESIRSESGTLVYVSHTPVDEPLVRVFYELYADKAAFQVHEEQPHTQRMLEERAQYLTSIEVEFMTETAGKRPAGPEAR